jgi:hypothetical protein
MCWLGAEAAYVQAGEGCGDNCLSVSCSRQSSSCYPLWGRTRFGAGKTKDIAYGRNGARPNSVTIRKGAIRAQTRIRA